MEAQASAFSTGPALVGFFFGSFGLSHALSLRPLYV
jgi:hypothetical protein